MMNSAMPASLLSVGSCIVSSRSCGSVEFAGFACAPSVCGLVAPCAWLEPCSG